MPSGVRSTAARSVRSSGPRSAGSSSAVPSTRPPVSPAMGPTARPGIARAPTIVPTSGNHSSTKPRFSRPCRSASARTDAPSTATAMHAANTMLSAASHCPGGIISASASKATPTTTPPLGVASRNSSEVRGPGGNGIQRARNSDSSKLRAAATTVTPRKNRSAPSVACSSRAITCSRAPPSTSEIADRPAIHANVRRALKRFRLRLRASTPRAPRASAACPSGTSARP